MIVRPGRRFEIHRLHGILWRINGNILLGLFTASMVLLAAGRGACCTLLAHVNVVVAKASTVQVDLL